MPLTNDKPSRKSIRPQVEALAANRLCPESRALYTTLAKAIHRRVEWRAHTHYSDLLSKTDSEEITADVLLQLISGSLVQFRGHSMGELIAYVRSISDRSLWRFARRRLRERDALAGHAGDAVRAWSAHLPSPEQALAWDPSPFLNEKDTNYLRNLLDAGSRAELARTSGVSRAAVTQRVQRIRARIDALPSAQRDATERWFRNLTEDIGLGQRQVSAPTLDW